ncbi:zinc ribbon domain-containing protein [Halobacteriales archaeon QS_4_70_19]|nr:MAG: zinc ribbon domain-containing protein [Halobacteriales archaeon QS_4_70_19]
MSSVDETTDPRCPECGGPIGTTATYCMHCSADLTEEQAAADADGDEEWDGTSEGADTGGGVTELVESAAATAEKSSAGSTAGESSGQLLDPDGLIDNSLTIIAGIVGGTIAGIVGTIVLGILTESGYGLLFGVVVWLLATAYLVRQRTVQGAVSKSGYAIALVLLAVPLLAFSPALEPEGGSRGGLFTVLLLFSVLPAGVAATVGWVAGRFVPDEGSDDTPDESPVDRQTQ